jgi:hypothetical protein
MEQFKNYFVKANNNKTNLFKGKNDNIKGLYAITHFMEDNITWLILAIILGLIIFYIVYLIKQRNNKSGPRKIKYDYTIYRVDDDVKHKPVRNKELECPMAINKYSFAFFLELNDFYCDTGYWKAIMVKGQELNKPNIKCGTYREDTTSETLEECFSKYMGNKDEDLKNYIQNGERINLEADLNKRVHLICKAHNLDLKNGNSDAKDMLSHAAAKCGLFTNEDGNVVRMSKGQCMNFINEHKDYCNMVYKVNKKVARDSSMRAKDKKGNYINKDKNERYYNDEYDNICSQDNLREKYPELLPKNLDSLKDINLINIAEKMDIKNGENKKDKSLEGCYDFSLLSNIKGGTKNTDITTDTGIQTIDDTNVLAECNRHTLGKANYFGINDNNCYTIELDKEKELIDLVNKEKDLIDNSRCGNSRTPDGNNIFISKALRPEENILLTCWENIINTYPTQNPGIWLHPYINDLRIVVTTQSGNKKTEYDQYLNEMIHPYKETSFSKLRNYNIEPIDLEDIISTEEATISDKQTLNISVAEKEEQIDSKIKEIKSHGGENKEEHSKLINDLQALTKEKEDLIKNTDNNVVSENTGGCIGKGEFNGVSYYREYFDVKNVPIKEKFHIAIIMNEKLVEIYINGNLHTSQTLFGEPRYNSGPLHISPGKNDKEADLKLNGVITDFKYYTHAINYINIRNIIAEKSVIQDTEAVILPEEHTHNVEVVHDHHHDILNEAEHKHGISDENVKTDYYLED